MSKCRSICSQNEKSQEKETERECTATTINDIKSKVSLTDLYCIEVIGIMGKGKLISMLGI